MLDEKREAHPSFGVVRVSKVSGQTYLFGSEANHMHFISLEICEADRVRSLSMDWIHGSQQIIEIWMTEAQWAQFVSSFNVGEGTPVTLKRVQGKRIPNMPEPVAKADEFKAEIQERLDLATTSLNEAISKLSEMLQPNAKVGKTELKKVLDGMQVAERNFVANLGFVADQFHEHLEKQINHAKIEAEAYLNRRTTELANFAMRQLVEQKDAPKLLKS